MKRKLLIALVVLLMLPVLGLAGLVFFAPSVPAEAIRASVIRTPALMEKAWRLPAASAFGGKLDFQSNGSKCGPASLANVFRSLDEGAASEDGVLSGTGKCSLGFCVMGLTLDELAQVAGQHTKRTVTVLRDLTPETFRAELRASNDAKRRYVVNFTRKAIFGAGGGHHSPIGGYLEDEDLVFVLDVNSKFGPWLVERSRLFAAVDTLDGQNKRGLIRIE